MADKALVWSAGPKESYILDSTGTFAFEVGYRLEAHAGAPVPRRAGLLVFEGFAEEPAIGDEPIWIGEWRDVTPDEVARMLRGERPFDT